MTTSYVGASIADPTVCRREDSAKAYAHGSKSRGSSAASRVSPFASTDGPGRPKSSTGVTTENSRESDGDKCGPVSAGQAADGCKIPKKQAVNTAKLGRIAIRRGIQSRLYHAAPNRSTSR